MQTDPGQFQDVADHVADYDAQPPRKRLTFAVRYFGWTSLFGIVAVMVNNILALSLDFPGLREFSFQSDQAIPQLSLYLIAAALAWFWVQRTQSKDLRLEAKSISDFNAYLIRACFFAVFFTGVVDATIALLRVENLLELFLSETVADNLIRARFIGPYIHIPLVCLGFIAALFTRTLGFTWLALLVVVAELSIVISRFLFSYEQALMGDLVRYWYSALFLFASAYTLLKNEHVRVDVLYAGFSDRKKGSINAIGTIFLGMSTCWTIIFIGFGHNRAIINSPVQNFEISQIGSAGMFIKYQMAAFLGVFAITMLIQFVSFLLAAFADYRDGAVASPDTMAEV